MAGEYSRELSAKVFAGQCPLIELGFRQGGRLETNACRSGRCHQGRARSRGAEEHLHRSSGTSARAHRRNRDCRNIYQSFVDERRSEQDTADALNAAQIATDIGRPWTRGTVQRGWPMRDMRSGLLVRTLSKTKMAGRDGETPITSPNTERALCHSLRQIAWIGRSAAADAVRDPPWGSAFSRATRRFRPG